MPPRARPPAGPARRPIRIKRAYDPPAPEDGTRILVDRLWPRGVRTETARLDDWRRELAPSEELRTWYAHDPAKFSEFRARYRQELLRHPERLAELVIEAETSTLTLVYAAKDSEHSNAAVLKELLEESLG